MFTEGHKGRQALPLEADFPAAVPAAGARKQYYG